MALSQLEKNDMHWCFAFHRWVSQNYEERSASSGTKKYYIWKGGDSVDKKKYTPTQVYIQFCKSF